MAYGTAQARQELLDSLAAATERLALALAALSEAYEHLDESTGETLERDLFRPVQLAYGQARHGHAAFAERVALPGRAFEAPPPPAPSRGVRGFLDVALESVQEADRTIASLQDSMLPVEVGDAELRGSLERVRSTLAPVAVRTRELERRLGR